MQNTSFFLMFYAFPDFFQHFSFWWYTWKSFIFIVKYAWKFYSFAAALRKTTRIIIIFITSPEAETMNYIFIVPQISIQYVDKLYKSIIFTEVFF